MESESKMIEVYADFVVRNDLEEVVLLTLKAVRPYSQILGNMSYFTLFPLFEAFGSTTHEFGNIMMSHPREFLDRLVNRIEELKEERGKEGRHSHSTIDDVKRIFSGLFKKERRSSEVEDKTKT